jgi:hypothetical protein
MITFVVWSINSSEEPVFKRGEELLKKKVNGANLDDLNLIKRLFLLYNGKLVRLCWDIIRIYVVVYYRFTIFSAPSLQFIHGYMSMRESFLRIWNVSLHDSYIN